MDVRADISENIKDMKQSIEIYNAIDETIYHLERTKALRVDKYSAGDNILSARSQPMISLAPLPGESLPVKYVRFNTALYIVSTLSRVKENRSERDFTFGAFLVYDWEKTHNLVITPEFVSPSASNNKDFIQMYQEAVLSFWEMMGRLSEKNVAYINSYYITDHFKKNTKLISTPRYPYAGSGGFVDVYTFAEELMNKEEKTLYNPAGYGHSRMQRRHSPMQERLLAVLNGEEKPQKHFADIIQKAERETARLAKKR